MIPDSSRWTDFSVDEWHRLSRLANKWEPSLRLSYTQTVVQGQQPNSLLIRNSIVDVLIDTAISSASVYGMVFNPNSPIYRGLADTLTDKYMSTVSNDSAKEKVRAILPSGLSLSERRNRLSMFGLDAKSAVRIERMRQQGVPEFDIRSTRIDATVRRGNTLAVTETNRVINATLEALWIDNTKIGKAENFNDVWFDSSVPRNVRSITGLPKRARKEIITRRDEAVCVYCEPLDGIKARLGEDFDTDYGYFLSPPFHPHCRCFMVVTL